MKCDLCDKDAVVHELIVSNGQKREIHLCAEHASAQGYAGPATSIPKEIADKLEENRPQKRSRLANCETCGLTLAAFRRHGVLGCPECYHAFERHLEPLIGRAQAGATHHCGHAPALAPEHIDRQLHRTRLLKDLNDAIACEQYERAAKIRDQLQNLEGPVESERE